MFISKEVDELSFEYISKPFGNKKDKRIGHWLDLLNRLNFVKEGVVNFEHEVGIDLNLSDITEIESIMLELLPWRKGPT